MSEREIVCAELGPAIDGLKRDGFRLDVIYPADEPHSALLSRDGDTVRLTSRPDAPEPSDSLPPFAPEFLHSRAEASAAEGRAGMLYRDLIPGRLGGRYVASHISMPGGGPVADWVHFHRVALQMIYVTKGWVRVVYEEQGDPFVIGAGDLVLQPPGIRHRVLESSAGAEVVEIGAPALHATFTEHELELPNGSNPQRIFSGQRFLHHRATEAPWTPFCGGRAQETAMSDASSGRAEVRTLRPGPGATFDFPPHDGELVFGFVLDGTAVLQFHGKHELSAADAFVIPPGEPWRLSEASPPFRLLQVTTSQLD